MSRIQSILISKDKMGLQEAINWIEEHNFKSSFGRKVGPHETDEYWRFRQRKPNKNERYRMKELTDGIYAIIGFSL